METFISSSFTKAAKQVLGEIGFPGITIHENNASEANGQQDSEILAMIGIVGELRGHLIIHFPLNGSTPFVSHLSGHLGMRDEDPEDIRYRKAALAEIANQISGAAVAILAEQGTDCLITPPTVLTGQSISAVLPEADQQYSFSVQGEFGKFSCILAIKNTKMI